MAYGSPAEKLTVLEGGEERGEGAEGGGLGVGGPANASLRLGREGSVGWGSLGRGFYQVGNRGNPFRNL